MIEPPHGVTPALKDPAKGVPDDCRAQMADVKGLGDIRGGKLDQSGFAFPFFGLSVPISGGGELRQDPFRPDLPADMKIHISGHGRAAGQELFRLKFPGDLLGQDLRRFAHLFGQQKARKRKVPPLRIAGNLDEAPDFFGGKPRFPGDEVRNSLGYVIHDFLAAISPQRAQRTQRKANLNYAIANKSDSFNEDGNVSNPI